MTKQLSDCCKAEIKLTGKERPNAFACEKCGRIIGTTLTTQNTEHTTESKGMYARVPEVDTITAIQNTKNIVEAIKIARTYYTPTATLRDEIEGMTPEMSPYIRNHGLPDHNRTTLTNCRRDGYKAALDDILALLNNK